jgi:hypothetical protein
MKKLLILLAALATANLYPQGWDDIYENKYSIPTKLLIEELDAEYLKAIDSCIKKAESELSKATQKNYSEKRKNALEKRISKLWGAFYKKEYPIATEACLEEAKKKQIELTEFIKESKALEQELKDEKPERYLKNIKELEDQRKTLEIQEKALDEQIEQLKNSHERYEKTLKKQTRKKSKKVKKEAKIEDFDVYYAKKYPVGACINIDNNVYYKFLIEKAQRELNDLRSETFLNGQQKEQQLKIKALQRRVNLLLAYCYEKNKKLERPSSTTDYEAFYEEKYPNSGYIEAAKEELTERMDAKIGCGFDLCEEKTEALADRLFELENGIGPHSYIWDGGRRRYDHYYRKVCPTTFYIVPLKNELTALIRGGKGTYPVDRAEAIERRLKRLRAKRKLEILKMKAKAKYKKDSTRISTSAK